MNIMMECDVTTHCVNIYCHVRKGTGKGVSLRSDSVVVDIRAIKTVVDDRQDPQVSTSLMAMVDSDGNIVVRDEVDDVEDFRIYAFVDDEPPPVIDDGSGGSGADPMGLGGMGGGLFDDEDE